MLHTLIAENYAVVVITIFMIIFINTNRSFEKDVTRLFLIYLYSLLALIIVDGVESWTATFTTPSILRILMSAIGYALRPFIIYIGILILQKNDNRRIPFLPLPAIINALVSFSALFSKIMFSYDEKNQFVRGPLGFITYFTCGIYIMAFVYFTIKRFTDSNHWEFSIVIAMGILGILSAILESTWGLSGFINTSLSITISFYYLFLHTQQFKRDTLTNTLNRRSFYLDADKYRDSLTAVVSLDLNHLKKINDSFGHAAGDTAICCLVSCVKENLPKGCTLYRTGGDEFMILCCSKSEEEIQKMISDITRSMEATDYSFAIGTAPCSKRIPFEKSCAKADAEMYKNKCLYKASLRS